MIKLVCGDSLKILKRYKSNTFDSLVTDPPAGISFMGKEWDSNKGGRDQWIAWMTDVMRECLRVMKPGAHGFVWAIPRTSHWTATALENAGFEIRDVVTHLFGSGFPKSLDISKAIDKAAGAKRPVIGSRKADDIRGGNLNHRACNGDDKTHTIDITAPATSAAKQWSGWGTELKPAAEFWWLIRKPLSEKTVAKNVLKWGTGGINIDGGRIGSETGQISKGKGFGDAGIYGKGVNNSTSNTQHQGRWPANLTLDEYAARMLDEQSGKLCGPGNKRETTGSGIWNGSSDTRFRGSSDNGGGASRFFYCAKASKSERGKDNNHPTVKPLKLMRYLCRLVTPPHGRVLDPFMGSGSTGMAAKLEKFSFIGIEQNKAYTKIAEKRIRRCR